MTFQAGTIIIEDEREYLKMMAVARARDVLLHEIQKNGELHYALAQIEAIQGAKKTFNENVSLTNSRAIAAIGKTMNGINHSTEELHAMIKSAYDSASAILIKKYNHPLTNAPEQEK